MGLLRKAVRKATPRPVRQVKRAVTHPVSTAARAATPRPVRNVSRQAYNVTHPVNAAENKLVNELAGSSSHARKKPSKRTAGSAQTQVAPPGSGDSSSAVGAGRYAAIAVASSSGEVGYSYAASDRVTAEQLALDGCRASDATVLVSAVNSWVALAENPQSWKAAYGPTREQAEEQALSNWPGGEDPPQIVISFFAPDGPTHDTPSADPAVESADPAVERSDGERDAVKCPACGYENPGSPRRCRKCAADLPAPGHESSDSASSIQAVVSTHSHPDNAQQTARKTQTNRSTTLSDPWLDAVERALLDHFGLNEIRRYTAVPPGAGDDRRLGDAEFEGTFRGEVLQLNVALYPSEDEAKAERFSTGADRRGRVGRLILTVGRRQSVRHFPEIVEVMTPLAQVAPTPGRPFSMAPLERAKAIQAELSAYLTSIGEALASAGWRENDRSTVTGVKLGGMPLLAQIEFINAWQDKLWVRLLSNSAQAEAGKQNRAAEKNVARNIKRGRTRMTASGRVVISAASGSLEKVSEDGFQQWLAAATAVPIPDLLEREFTLEPTSLVEPAHPVDTDQEETDEDVVDTVAKLEPAADSNPGSAKNSELSTDPVERLRKLAKLRDGGVITEEEFNNTKAELLSRI